MPVTIDLDTVIGAIERGDSITMKRLEYAGTSLGRETVKVSTVADIRAAVQAFGARVRAAHPHASFMVSISIRRGDRKPNGYDRSYPRNGLGQEDFLHVLDKRTVTAVNATKADAVPTASDAA